MKYLLDTCAISELVQKKSSSTFINWLTLQSSDKLFLSAITVGELQKGIDKLEESKRKKDLILWLAELEEGYAQNILTFDKEVAKTWGNMVAFLEKNGKIIPIADSMIGAVALYHNMILVTRNVKDFKNMPIELLSPWDE